MAPSPEKPKINAPPTSVTGSGPSGVVDQHHDIFFAAVETTRMPMIVTDPHQNDNPIIFANNAFLRMTGYERSEMIGHNCRFLQGQETDKETIREIRNAVAERREFSTEVLNYRKDGSTFWNALFVSPVYSPAGDLVYFFGSQLDVSRRRDAEEALHQSQKMEALGQLTGGIAHDFNNLLQVISGYTDVVQVLGEKGRGGGEIDTGRLCRAGEALRSATDRASKLTHQLLAFARKQRLEGRATPDGGLLTVETANRIVHDDEQALRLGVKQGLYAQVSVSDTGEGMSPDVQARVMEPFFTTKPEGKGTGLGLAMVYGFAKQSNGAVEIVSEVGKGTTISLLFPATDQAIASETQPAQRAADRDGTETVLIVDDRAEVAETASMILSDFGYTSVIANGPEQALSMLDGETRIDLLFTDLIMPGGMNGVMLARAARERQPKIRVLLTTGYAEASLERTDAGGSEFEIIMKPYRRLDLARRVRRVLDGPTGVG